MQSVGGNCGGGEGSSVDYRSTEKIASQVRLLSLVECRKVAPPTPCVYRGIQAHFLVHLISDISDRLMNDPSYHGYCTNA